MTTDETKIPRLVSGFDKTLDGLGTAARATSDQAYHKSEFAHAGVSLPELRKVMSGLHAGLGGRKAAREDVLALAARLWDSDVYERRLAAVITLHWGVKKLTTGDLEDVTLMLRDAPMWSLVDPLSSDVAGNLVVRDPAGTGPTLDQWAAADDFWLRRAALLALRPGIKAGLPDLPRFSRYADSMVEDKEFFVRKAIGWVLRELAVKDPVWVEAWVAARTHRMAGVTFREAVRKLPEQSQGRLAEAYKRKVAA